MQPEEFNDMIINICDLEKALGAATLVLNQKSMNNLVFARSLYVVEDVKQGGVLTDRNVRPVRPSHGLALKHFKDVIGKKQTKGLPRVLPYPGRTSGRRRDLCFGFHAGTRGRIT